MRQLPNPMTLTLALFALLTLAISFLVLAINIRSAQEGYEDESGFHPVGVNAQNGSPVASEGRAILVRVSAHQAGV